MRCDPVAVRLAAAMDQRLTLLTLGVRDLEAARRFYVDGLGWEPTLVVEGEVVFIQLGHGLLLGLYSELAEDAGVPLARSGTPPVSLAYNVGSEEQVIAFVERARAAGATVVKEPQPAVFGGPHAYFADPDGFLWEIAYNPGLRFGPDGRASFG
jgi:catechol 2,3-dioxygenase-like lactoylglutathione lyase family enzyme